MVLKIVIAGAGIIGNSIAYYLTRDYADISVTLVDPVGICPAASAKAGGFLARDWRDTTPLEALHRRGFVLHETLATELDGRGADARGRTVNRRTDYRRLRCAAAAVDGSALDGHASKKIQGAATLEWVDEGALLGAQALGTEDDIAQVHPKKLCEAMWEVSSAKGAALRIGRVVGATLAQRPRTTPQVEAVRLEDGTIIEADVLVAALGPWSEEIRRWFPPTDDAILEALAGVPRIEGTKSHSMLVRTPSPLHEAVFFQSDDPALNDLEVYPRPDGDTYVTGSHQTKSEMTERPGEEAVEPHLEEELRSSARRTSPKLLGAQEPHTMQACYWPDTIDGLPVIGPLANVQGVYLATGHSVWGIQEGPSTGEALSELIMEGESRSVALKDFHPGVDRLATLFEAATGGDPAPHLAEYLVLYKSEYGVQGTAAQEGSDVRGALNNEL